MHARAQTKVQVLSILIAAMKQFKVLVHKLKLKLSPKAAIVTSGKKLSSRLHARLVEYGLKFIVAEHSRDLGVTTTAGKSTPSNLQSNRQVKSRNRIVKIASIAEFFQKINEIGPGFWFCCKYLGTPSYCNI